MVREELTDKGSTLKRLKEGGIKSILFICAIFAVFVIFFILFFLLRDGIPIFQKVGIWNFLSGNYWNPTGIPPSYGAYPLIAGTLLVTLGAMVIAIPLGIGSAIFISQLAPSRIKILLKTTVELLAGIPSVVYGFFGLIVLTTWIKVTFNQPSGECWLAGSIILAIMALPTIISVAEDAISSVPREYREASLAIGATKWQTIKKAIVPSALSGITAAIILGMGRVVGETMAVMMVTGNAAILPQPITNIFSPIRTITGTLGIEMGEVATGSDHYYALFGLAVVLLVITLIINVLSTMILGRIRDKQMPSVNQKNKNATCDPEKKLISRDWRRKAKKPFYFILFVGLASLIVFWTGIISGLIIIFVSVVIYYLGKRFSQKNIQRTAFSILTCAMITVICLLGIILAFIVFNGAGALSWEFISQPPRDNGRSGGIFPAIVGTLYLVGGALLFALPIGICAAIYLAEYKKEGKIVKIIRAGIDILNGTPSIVFGLFGFAFLVLYLHMGVSLLAGQITLAFMILPTIIRTTEEAIKSVPQSVREGSLALGATKWQTIRKVVLPPAAPGIVTGAVLGIGRAAGETAPIMFTAAVFMERYLPSSVLDPVMALPYHLFALTTSVPGSQHNAYGTGLVLLLLVVAIYSIAVFLRYKYSKAVKW